MALVSSYLPKGPEYLSLLCEGRVGRRRILGPLYINYKGRLEYKDGTGKLTEGACDLRRIG